MTLLAIYVAIAILVSFLCSILEAVLLSTSHSFLETRANEGSPGAALFSRLRTNVEQPIAAILTLNTIANTVGATLAGAQALQIFGQTWIAVFSAVFTLSILIGSEIIPKTIGATYWKHLAIPSAYILRVLIVVLRPILIPLSWIGSLIAPRKNDAPTISRAELGVLASIGRREGSIDDNEWRIMTRVMNLHEITAGEVMTPRIGITAVPKEATIAQAKTMMLTEGHLRMPVFEGSIDNIIGILLGRDVLRAEDSGATTIQPIIREALFVPQSEPVEDLLLTMRRRRVKMAIVLDEFGGTAGVITMEDLLEEIVGEIQDEHEYDPLPIEELETGEIMLDGKVSVREANDSLGLTLPEDRYETVGGFVFGELGHIPAEGEEVPFAQGRFRVLTMEGRRVTRVVLIREESGEESPEE